MDSTLAELDAYSRSGHCFYLKDPSGKHAPLEVPAPPPARKARPGRQRARSPPLTARSRWGK